MPGADGHDTASVGRPDVVRWLRAGQLGCPLPVGCGAAVVSGLKGRLQGDRVTMALRGLGRWAA